MIDHVTIRVSDRSASERFYDTVLGYYSAYVIDPDGYNVEVVNHHR